MYHRGLVIRKEKGFVDEMPTDDNILVPLKEDFTLMFEEANCIVERIGSLEARKMLEYTIGIDFWIEPLSN